MKALATAFLMWQEEQPRLHEAGDHTSWNMYRRKLKAFYRKKFNVSLGTLFSREAFMLAGGLVHDIAKEPKTTVLQSASRAQVSPFLIPPEVHRLSRRTKPHHLDFLKLGFQADAWPD